MYHQINSWLENLDKSELPQLNLINIFKNYKLGTRQRLILTTKLMQKFTLPDEKIIQLRPKFHYIPKIWFPYYIKTQMTHSKRLQGIYNPWMGYFFVSDFFPTNEPYISRFKPISPYYQSWFGIYLIKWRKSKPFGYIKNEPNLEILLRAGIGDQFSWLMKYRVRNPLCECIETDDPNGRKFKIKDNTGIAWECLFITQSDFNSKGSIDWRYNLIFGKADQKYKKVVKENHRLYLKGIYVAGIDYIHKLTWIIYGVASIFKTRTNILIDNYKILKNELTAMARNVELFVPM